LWVDSPPSHGRPTTSALSNTVYVTDHQSEKTLEAIQTYSSDIEIMIAQCTEQDGRIQYRVKCYVPAGDQLQ
jgi:hypothetical protein